MALQEQTAKLIDKLIELSEQGKVSWQETADENTFLASVNKFVVTIAKPDYQSGYEFVVTDQVGRTLEEARAIGNQDAYYERLGLLQELARRSARNVGEALSDLLSSLEQIH
jgi:hypothetical protein